MIGSRCQLLWLSLLLICGPWGNLPSKLVAATSDGKCTANLECEKSLRKGSLCIDGKCSNPFYNGGCLKNLLPGWNRMRICNSQDPPEAEELGYCRSSPMEYMEVRISSANWESHLINDWLLQILLSELLDVPVSLEGGAPEVSTNLYRESAYLDYLSISPTHSDSLTQFGVAARVKDCRKVTSGSVDSDSYEECFHLNPEVWWKSLTNKSGVQGLARVMDLGVLSEIFLAIPKFVAQKDLSLVSYYGLAGPENRRKLAETFKTPTRWGMYCQEVSPSNCTEVDLIAQRSPRNKTEEMAFFVPGVYNGHFRKVEEADCDKYPSTCAGDFINVPCDWTSYAKQQFYHNDIALEMRGPNPDGGYSYAEMFEIYHAADATRSPIMMAVFNTDPPFEEFMHTDSQYTRVQFPPQTQECLDNRIATYERCDVNATFLQTVGPAEGACDTYPQPLKKLLSHTFQEITIGDDIPKEFKSPAYDAVELYQLTELAYGEIFSLWFERAGMPDGYALADATCQWAVDNFELLTSFIPDSHPRIIMESDEAKVEGLKDAALGIAIVAAILVVLSLFIAFLKRKTKVFFYLQNVFLNLLLAGMMLIAVGAILLAAPISDTTCMLVPWTTNFGYVLQLVPLYVRISAISNLATSGKQMQRVRLKPSFLCRKVAAVACLVGAFVMAWTIVDPPQKTYEYEITNVVSLEGETIIIAYDFCGSKHIQWVYAALGWRAVILAPSCMLAFLARRVKEDMNDTKAMSLALSAHMGFLLLDVVVFSILQMNSESADSSWNGYSSIILSSDTIVSLVIYILPKFLDSGETLEDEPLPDVFVHTTIALMDVQGFTAWSSVREPVQVFQFLEQLYGHFDKLAESHQVYKVETVGECYVAATGIPNAQSDHCLLMASFAIDCMRKMPKYVMTQEVKFGPDTSNLTLRIGIHSGCVTGGFLKGKGSRFQLFGDTMTTASLIQSHGMSNRIHVSAATADLLIKGKKQKWIMEREDRVHTLEKGELRTWWLVKGFRHEYVDTQSGHGSAVSSEGDNVQDNDGLMDVWDSQDRWVEFNVETFKSLLKQLIACRGKGYNQVGSTRESSITFSFSEESAPEQESSDAFKQMPLEEVQEIINLPGFDKRKSKRQTTFDLADTKIPDVVVSQLRDFIREIALRYNDNPFHNFAHASYVVMAVTKYMHRIVAATEIEISGVQVGDDRTRSSVQAALHDHTYGITSDPLTQFSAVFSALIHDVDHPGVPNSQLIQEDEQVAKRYKYRSVAEQKSFDIAWDLLKQESFTNLLSTICTTPRELCRFRALVINSVMATDLGDHQLKELRNSRWLKAFATDESSATHIADSASTFASSQESGAKETKETQINRKATIVIEHLIQAADVAHMSQHWHIYRQWNERLFREAYKAYCQGRAEKNPADGWYKGEIGFFDYYIIPLSKKLRDCGVFGPTSDENLNYSTNNRNMWVAEGEQIVREMLQRAAKDYPQRQMP